MKLRLLKRVHGWEVARAVSASEADIDEVLESLRDDLEKLFNTRRGTVLIDDDYGLPDFTHLMNGYAAPDADQIERDLLQQVRRYEPRLSTVGVSAQAADQGVVSLQFGLSANFAHKNQDVNFAAIVRIADNGSISVSI